MRLDNSVNAYHMTKSVQKLISELYVLKYVYKNEGADRIRKWGSVVAVTGFDWPYETTSRKTRMEWEENKEPGREWEVMTKFWRPALKRDNLTRCHAMSRRYKVGA